MIGGKQKGGEGELRHDERYNNAGRMAGSFLEFEVSLDVVSTVNCSRYGRRYSKLRYSKVMYSKMAYSKMTYSKGTESPPDLYADEHRTPLLTKMLMKSDPARHPPPGQQLIGQPQSRHTAQQCMCAGRKTSPLHVHAWIPPPCICHSASVSRFASSGRGRRASSESPEPQVHARGATAATHLAHHHHCRCDRPEATLLHLAHH